MSTDEHEPTMVELDIDEDSAWWWERLQAGEFCLPVCDSQQHVYFPPAPACPECGDTSFTPTTASRSGEVYSWVTVRRAMDADYVEDVPYSLVAVDLDAGPRMIGRLRGGAADPAARVALAPFDPASRFAIEFVPEGGGDEPR